MRAILPFETLAAKIQGREVLFNAEVLHAARSPHMINDKAKAELGFNPRPVNEAFKATYEWFDKMNWLN